VNFSQYFNLISVLVVFFFLEYPFQISRFLGFLGPILLKVSLMVGLSNERDRKLISVRTSVWDLGKRFSKVTLCIRLHERNGEISRSLIGHKKYKASDFVLNQKQERKWVLDLVRWRKSPRGSPDRLVNFCSHQVSARTDFARFIIVSHPDYLPLGLREWFVPDTVDEKPPRGHTTDNSQLFYFYLFPIT